MKITQHCFRDLFTTMYQRLRVNIRHFFFGFLISSTSALTKDAPLQSLLTVDSASCQVKASLGMGGTGTFNEDPGVCAVHNQRFTVKKWSKEQ